MHRWSRRLLLLAAAGLGSASSVYAFELCDPAAGRPCPTVLAHGTAPLAEFELRAPLRVPSESNSRSLLTVLPAPPPSRTLGAKLWDLVREGVRLDGTVSPSFDDGPPLPGGGKRGFELAMVGVRVSFGETVATELWAEVVGIEMLDHRVTLDGSFRPF